MSNMKISKNQIVELLINHVNMSKRISRLDDVLGKDSAFTEYFGEQLDSLTDLILDLCGVPAEGTNLESLGFSAEDWEEGFCRDGFLDELLKLEDLDGDELETACDFYVMHLIDEWFPDTQYITKRSAE